MKQHTKTSLIDKLDAMDAVDQALLGFLIMFIFGLGMILQWAAMMLFGDHWWGFLPGLATIGCAIFGRRVLR